MYLPFALLRAWTASHDPDAVCPYRDFALLTAAFSVNPSIIGTPYDQRQNKLPGPRCRQDAIQSPSPGQPVGSWTGAAPSRRTPGPVIRVVTRVTIVRMPNI